MPRKVDEVNIEVQVACRVDAEGYLITYRGSYYFCDKYWWDNVSQPWRDVARQRDMITITKDFGGCGKDAVKRQHVPLIVYLSDADKFVRLRDPAEVQLRESVHG